MKLTTFRTVWTAYTYPSEVIDADWDTVAEVLLSFNKVQSKDEVGLFNVWQFAADGEKGRKYHDKSKTTWDDIAGTVRRCSANAQGLWGLMLDFDKNCTIEQVCTELEGLEYVLYTTFSHSTAQDKFRVIMPFDRMMTIAEYEAKKAAITATFPRADMASFSMSQSFYFHSGQCEREAIAYRSHGHMLSPAMFEDTVQVASVPVQHDISNISRSDWAQLEALLLQLRMAHPVPEYSLWIKIMFATASEIGNDAAAMLLATIWPEHHRGEYRQHLHGRDVGRSPKIGTLVHLVKEINGGKSQVVNNNKF